MKKLEWDSNLLKCEVYQLDDIQEIQEIKSYGLYYLRAHPGIIKNEKGLIIHDVRKVRTIFKIGIHLRELTAKTKKELTPLTQGKQQKIIDEGAESFKFSRFHEDLKISNFLALNRMKMQIASLISDNTKMTYVLNLSSPIAFVNYTIDKDVATLNLGACFKNYGFLFPELINSTLNRLAEQGIKKVITEISAANKPIVSFYLNQLDFKLIEVFEDYTLRYNPNLTQ